MPLPRLTMADTALLVLDVQEKLVPAVAGRRRLVNNCAILLRMAAELDLPALVTEHYPKGLGRTVDALAAVMVDPAARVEKTTFSGAVDLVLGWLDLRRRSTVLVCGIETHVCVLQTVLDLQDSGRQCFVVSDAIASSQADQRAGAVRRMEAAGAVTTGVMSAMYELIGGCDHPARRRCVELAKAIEGPSGS